MPNTTSLTEAIATARRQIYTFKNVQTTDPVVTAQFTIVLEFMLAIAEAVERIELNMEVHG